MISRIEIMERVQYAIDIPGVRVKIDYEPGEVFITLVQQADSEDIIGTAQLITSRSFMKHYWWDVDWGGKPLREDEDAWSIINVEIEDEYKGKGYSTPLLKIALDLGEKTYHNKVVDIVAEPEALAYWKHVIPRQFVGFDTMLWVFTDHSWLKAQFVKHY